jgi:hypothetical protein
MDLSSSIFSLSALIKAVSSFSNLNKVRLIAYMVQGHYIFYVSCCHDSLIKILSIRVRLLHETLKNP